MQDLVVVYVYDGDQDEYIFEEFKLWYIIMYELDVVFICCVEVYWFLYNDRNVCVYFFYYGGFVEE